MVKSYNRKGFGFIMCQNLDADVYFSRESLAPQLQTSDLAGEYVTFECHRFPDGKLQARNLRPVGDTGITRGPDGFGGANFGSRGTASSYGSGNRGAAVAMGGSREEEDRSRDWYCDSCGERNFVKRFECFKCKALRPREAGEGPVVHQPPVRRTLSPHAGSRAMREVFRQQQGIGKACSRSPSRPRRRKKSSSSVSSAKQKQHSDSSGSSSSDDTSEQKRKQKKRRRSRSKGRKGKSSSSGGSSSVSGAERDATLNSSAAASSAPMNPEVEKAKAEVLEKLLKLKQVEPKDARIRDWRALLREWHPDKNPDRVEVATAVFQFLQKGKALIDAEGK